MSKWRVGLVFALFGALTAFMFGNRPVVRPPAEEPAASADGWWYWNGNLADESGKLFGFHLALFEHEMHDGTTALSMHFSLSDGEKKAFHAAERSSEERIPEDDRERTRVGIGEWRAERVGDDWGAVHIATQAEGFGIDVELSALKPVVMQRPDVSAPAGASYATITRMTASGTVKIANRSFTVSGSAWFDRERGPGLLSARPDGWQWFGVQLSDGRDLVIYDDRRGDPIYSAVLVGADGKPDWIAAQDISLAPEQYWESGDTGVRYPVGWSVRIPSRAVDVRVEPLFPEQEVTGTVAYWEGAVLLRDGGKNAPVAGRGYLELVGYAVGE